MPPNVHAKQRAGWLAAEVSSFVDRRNEIIELKQHLSVSRLVTITGVGGAGKTRLAIKVAREVRRAFSDGVWQVDLAAIRDGAMLEYAVAEALQLRGSADMAISDLLADYLRERQLLLVLDNCEHVVDECAALINFLLRTAPQLRVLCTSRQPLGTVGESLALLLPLPVPTNGTPLNDTSAATYPALTLFAERAAAVVPGFALSEQNLGAVAEICAQLDGLPLAIELAAAQLYARSIDQVAAGLADRFRLLGARHAVPAHHRRLQDAFDWSYATCSDAEQVLWQRVAVFYCGFDLDAAVAVCAGEDLPAEAVLDVMSGLINKSIVTRDESAGTDRYRLLETVREYGLSRLRANTRDNEARLRRAHRDWYLRLAERFDAEWFGPHQVRWLARLREDWPNLRAAIDFSLTEPGEAYAAIRLTISLHYFWLSGGALQEGRYWLSRALSAERAPTAERAMALHVNCRILVSSQGRQAEANASRQECLELARRLNDPALLARAHQVSGLYALFQEDFDTARSLLEEATALFAEVGQMDSTAASAQTTLAMAVLSQGDSALATEICLRTYSTCVASGELWARSQALNWLSLAALREGDVAKASAYVEERLRIKGELGDILGIATAMESMAGIAVGAGDHERAARLLGAADQTRQKIGQRTLASAWHKQWRQEHVEATKTALGEAAFEELFRRGARLGDEEAMAFALGRPEPVASGSESTPSEPAPLTRRERQVAELVAEGLSNRQIAQRLVISQRTAEGHVERVLTKLSFNSRTQIAAWVMRNRDP